MKKITFQFELLVIMDSVENVGTYFKEIWDYFSIWIFLRCLINRLKNLIVLFVGLLLESVILIDFIRLKLQKPTHCLWLNKEFFIFIRLERIHSIREYFVIINIFIMLTEQKLRSLWIFLSIKGVHLHSQLIIFKNLLFDNMLFLFNVLWVGFYEIWGSVVLRNEVIFFH